MHADKQKPKMKTLISSKSKDSKESIVSHKSKDESKELSKSKSTPKKSPPAEKLKKKKLRAVSASVKAKKDAKVEHKAELPASLKKSKSKSPRRTRSVKKEDVITEAKEPTQEEEEVPMAKVETEHFVEDEKEPEVTQTKLDAKLEAPIAPKESPVKKASTIVVKKVKKIEVAIKSDAQKRIEAVKAAKAAKE